MTKAEIRKEILPKREKIENREKKNSDIMSRLLSLDAYKKAKTIMVYLSYRGEVDTLKIIETIKKDGKNLCAPVCENKTLMVAKSFESIKDLKKGAYGILEPCGKAVKDIDLILVPGVAFNEKRHRIGYGAGYYDRFLKENKAKNIGLFYEMQKADFINDETDVSLDIIITENKIYGGK